MRKPEEYARYTPERRPITQEYRERTKPLTENEKAVLGNVRGMFAWLAKHREGNVDAVLAKHYNAYRAEFEKEFSGFERLASEEEMLDSAKQASVVFLGDYHNLRKSQEYAAEILAKLVEKQQEQPWGLAVEFVKQKDQGLLDTYLKGSMDVYMFLKKIGFANWEKDDRWSGWQKILETAKNLNVPVYGINTPTAQMSLARKEKALAAHTKEILTQQIKRKLAVHIGDQHLAQAHFPHTLAAAYPGFQTASSVRIVQNIPEIYFSALERYAGFKVPKVLRVRNGAYHVRTAPLLTRILSDYENMYERKPGSGTEDDFEEFMETEFGPEILARLRKLFGAEDTNDTEITPSYFFGDSGDEILQDIKKTSSADFWRYQKTLTVKGCAYVPSHDAIIVKQFRLKRILEELTVAALIPQRSETGGFLLDTDERTKILKGLDSRVKHRLNVFQYIGSKFFIPEREPENEIEEEAEAEFQEYLSGKNLAVSKIT